MGKASKWIRNLLMGKREDKGHDTCPSVPAETRAWDTPVGISPVNTPKVKGRWSFKRLTSKKARSFDSSILMPKQALLEYWTQPILLNEYAAATKIQAVYRSYLARRALRALRALVKLQALVRGHLVRKQMNTIVRSMHAVMAIQVRARIHRIQVAPVTPRKGRRKSFTESSPSDTQSRKQISEYITSGSLRSTSGHMDHTLIGRVESNTRIRTFDPLSFSQREHRLKMCPSPSVSSFTDSSSTAYDGQLEEFSQKMARRNSTRYSTFPENKHPCIPPPAQSHFIPNYMNNTKSSEAKARSHSEPKQRPKLGTKQKSRRSPSMDGNNDKENQYLWLMKLYHCNKCTNDGDSDSNITAITRKSPIPIEPPMNLY